MTNEEIHSMAREAGFERVVKACQHTGIKTIEAYAPDSLERFAALVAAKERDACASICESRHANGNYQNDTRHECAAAIRTRGQE